MMIKILSMITIIAVCSSAFGFAGGNGSPENPYQISTEAHLLQVNNEITASYILVNNIVLTGQYSDALISAGEGNAIANFDGAAFRGSFDGNGYVIKNLNISGGTTNNIGLFGYVYQGTIKNLGIEGFNVSGNEAIGALAARNEGVIDSCYAAAAIPGDPNSIEGNMFVGGLIGLVNQGSTTINCWADATVQASSRVGGLVGQTNGDITGSYAMGNVHATNSSAWNQSGGLVGWHQAGIIQGCYATGNVSGDGERIGGLVGQAATANGKIINCYATGNVTHTGPMTGNNYVGGLVGLCLVDISNSFATGNVNGAGGARIGGFVGQIAGNVTNCYATGAVRGDNTFGGLLGFTDNSIVTDSYATGKVSGSSVYGGFLGHRHNGGSINGFWDTETSETTTAIGTGGPGGGVVTGKTTAEMQTKQTFTDASWDFAIAWIMSPQMGNFEGYPILQWQVNMHPADLNRDGIVDIIDFASFTSDWLSEAY